MADRVSSQGTGRNAVDHALDLFLYLPVGAVFELPRTIPRFIERGRRELSGGDGAGMEWPSPLERVQAHAIGTLRALGVMVPAGRDAGGDANGARADVAEPDAATTATVPIEDAAPPEPAIDADELAIPGYDSLSASQVIPRLESLSPEELELVRGYEQASRGRKTILNKIAQLQAR